MSKATKKWLIIASCFLLVGFVIFGSISNIIGWDVIPFSQDYQTLSGEIMEEFNSISIETTTADIFFTQSRNGTCVVECYDKDDVWYSCEVRDNTLKIQYHDDREWYKHLGLDLDTPKITVYLPKTHYDSLFIEEDTGDIHLPKDFAFKETDITLATGDVNFYAAADAVKIKTSTGDVEVEDASIGSLDVSVTTGEVSLENVKCAGDLGVEVTTGEVELDGVRCKNLASNGSTGSITLKNTVATEKLVVDRSTGGVKFEGADAGEITVTTDTGGISGTLLSEKVFIAQSDTGRVSVPETTSGGKCKLTTDTGSIKIKISNKK